MRTCKRCEIEKPLTEFYKKKCGWYELYCKKCYLDLYSPNRGKPNTGRYKKGNIPVTRKEIDGRQSLRAKQWKKDVIKRDKFTCQECSSINHVVAHHIKSWIAYPELRFDLKNGITLCNLCHSILHGKQKCNLLKNGTSWSKGKTFSAEYRKKLSDAHLGQKAWNHGLEMSNKAKSKLISVGAFFKKGHIPWIKEHGHSKESKAKMSKAHTGKTLSEEHRRNISKANTGRVVSAETKEKLSKANKGHIISAETRLKISKSLMGRPANSGAFGKGNVPWNLGLDGFMKGRKVSAETRHKISESNIGKKHSIESREKMSQSHSGKILSEEHRRKISEAGKGRIISLETRNKIRNAQKGRKISDEHRRNLCIAQKKRLEKSKEKI